MSCVKCHAYACQMLDQYLRVLVVPSLLSSFLCRESARVREKERERAREESARAREREQTRTRSRTSCTGASRALADGCHPPLWIASSLGYSFSTLIREDGGRRRDARARPLSYGCNHCFATPKCRSTPVQRRERAGLASFPCASHSYHTRPLNHMAD